MTSNPSDSPLIQSTIPKLRKRFFDFDVVATLGLRVWSLLAGTITVLAVPFWLTKSEQGYYFTFASILALQVFFELGLNYVLVQFVGGLMSKLNWSESGELDGEAVAIARLGSLVWTIVRIFLVLALLYFVIVGTGGALFFVSTETPASPSWELSWWIVAGCTAGNLFLSPLLAISEGAGKLGSVARARILQSIFGYSAAWAAMASGLGLLAIPFIAGANLLGALFWLAKQGRFLLTLIRRARDAVIDDASLRWRTEIFPFQWRIALSWASGYLIFQLFNPVIFKYHGAVVAGQIGLALAIFNSLITLSMSWVNAKSPEFARQVAAGRRQEARALFKHQFIISTSVNILMVSILLVGYVLLSKQFDSLFRRMPGFTVLLWMALAAVANQIVFSLAVFMRAHGKEPLLLVSIVTGVLTLLVMSFSGPLSVELVMSLYAAVQVFVCLPWVVTMFLRSFWNIDREVAPVQL